jgi:Tol biopolymer transport system component/DNA-binding winged helix-turn-helix (wHTH) protein
MVPESQPPVLLTFGPFEVNPKAGELRKNGIHIRLSGQPFQILLILLQHPGELVTRERLRDRVWNDGTFVDFEGGLNSAINKLRRALNDSAETPRYIETVPARGYRFIGHLEHRGSAPVPSAARSILRENEKRRRGRWLWVASAVSAVAVSFVLGWLFHDAPDALPPWKLSQITVDAGLSEAPALSPDGKLIAYWSDRNPDNQGDLYIKQVAGGQPIRLTFDGAPRATPNFSPDGSKIVFRSNRDGGGIYEIPAFGGEVRLLARDGWSPKFSPDGSQVAYWIGAPNVAVTVPGGGAVWMVPAAGGLPRRVGANFTSARYPIWSPDGKHLLLIGYTSENANEKSALDWWLVPVNGGQPIQVGIYESLVRAGLEATDVDNNPAGTLGFPSVPRPGCWLDQNRVIFSTASGDTWNLWETSVSREGKVTGVFKRLTAAPGNEGTPSCTSDRALAFANVKIQQDVWWLPFDLDHGKPKGVLQQIAGTPGVRDHASLSDNGRYLAFASTQSGHMNIWLRDLASGSESHVTSSMFVQRYPVVSPSGGRVAFSSFENEKRLVYVSTPGGTPERLCQGCLRATDWSRDEKTLLVFSGSPYQINVLDIASHEQTPILKHATYPLLYGRFSPDNRWVSFTARTKPNRAWIAIAPVDGQKPVPESSWIRISEEGAEDWANWSPDGKTLYFTSARDGYTCLWGQRLDAVSHKPTGQAFAVQHLHGRLSYEQDGWSAAGGRIAMVLEGRTGNLWMMTRSGRH